MEENPESPIPQPNRIIKYSAQLVLLVGLYMLVSGIFASVSVYIVKAFTGIDIALSMDAIVADVQDPTKVFAYKLFQLIASFGSFAMTALIFTAVFARENVREYYGFSSTGFSLPTFSLLIVIVLASLPVISYIAYLNRELLPPGTLGDFEKSVIQQQEANEALHEQFLKADGIAGLLFNVLVIALVPALGEELLFRGAFMQVFYRLTGRIHLSIVIVALLFALIHLQVYNFFAITFMGIMFGYLYSVTGNILVPALAHFLNNALVVVGSYYYQQNPDVEFASYDYDFTLVPALIGAVILVAAMAGFYRLTRPYHAPT